MAVYSLTSSPTTIEDGTHKGIDVTNTGTMNVTLSTGDVMKPGAALTICPTGAITATSTPLNYQLGGYSEVTTAVDTQYDPVIIRENIENALAEVFPTLSDIPICYVTVTGSDSNSGKSWATGKATAAAAQAALLAGPGYGFVLHGSGTFTTTDSLVPTQAIKILGQGPQGVGSGGTTIVYTGPDDGRAAIRTAKDYPGTGGYPDFSFGQIRGIRLQATAMTQAVGLEWRNAQNNALIEDMFITGFHKGVYAYDSLPSSNTNVYPGYVTARRVWCTGNDINWHIRAGFTSIHLDMCAGDGKSNTTDCMIVDPPLVGGRGRDLNLILTGFKSENSYNGSTGDCNGITVNTDAAISLIGCSMRQPQTGTKPWINYTVTPVSSNSQTGTIPVKLVNCTTGCIPVTVKGPDGLTWLAPATTAGGEIFQIAEWSGGSEAPKLWRGTHSGLTADSVLVQPATTSAYGIHVDPPAGATGNAFEVSTAKVYDTFTRTDSASVLGTPNMGAAWTADRGTWGISSNKGYLASVTSDASAYIDGGAADGTLSCDITLSGTSGAAFPGLQFRRVDINNCLILRLKQSTGEVALQKQVAGVQTVLTDTTTTLTPGATVKVRIVLAGTLISVYINGTLQTSYTLSGGEVATFSTPTVVGLRQNNGTAPNDDGGSRYDNFRFAAVTTYIDAAGAYHSSSAPVDRRYAPNRVSATTTTEVVTCPPYGGQTSTPTAGVLYVGKITLTAGTRTTVKFSLTNGGSGLTASYIGLWDAVTLAKLADSGDVSASAFVTPVGVKSVTLNHTAAADMDAWIGLLIGNASTTPPQITTNFVASALAADMGVAQKHSTAGLTALPDPLVLTAAGSAAGFFLPFFRFL